MSLGSPLPPSALQDDEASETLPDIAQLDAKIAEAEEAMANAETAADKRKAKERREDLMRLKRVEQIYVRPHRTSPDPEPAHADYAAAV